jgi:hypothetical protein
MTAMLDTRLATLTPESLTEIVSAAGGRVVDTWEHTYPADQGGDGVQGHYVLYVSDAYGQTTGNVGFARTSGSDGCVVHTLADFVDDRYPPVDRDSWAVTDNRYGFLRMLTAFVPQG